MPDLNLDADSPAAREAARRARELIAARSGTPTDLTLFAATLTRLVNETGGDPEETAYLLAALASIAVAGFTLLGEETDRTTAEVLQAVAVAWERHGFGF